MDDPMARSLVKLYESYRYQLEAKKKLHSDSVLLSSMKLTKNVMFRMLKESALPLKTIPSSSLVELQNKGLIRAGTELSSFVITGKGIWYIEKEKGCLDENKLIDYINKSFFEVLVEDAKPLNDRDKVVVFTMLAVRAYSEDSAVDMRKSDSVKSTWLELFRDCSGKLREHGVIEQTEEEIFPMDIDYEDPASHFIRHTDGLPRKTKAIYVTSSKRTNRYYLDVSEGDSVDKEKLAFLYWLVFGDRLDSDNVYTLFEFCRSIAYDYAMKVFDHEKHVYANPAYDDVVRGAMMETIVSRQKWQTS